MKPYYEQDGITIHLGDARSVPLPDASVQCIVTSPPYWGLRDYGVDGQLGLESTPEEYVAAMVDVFREGRRVLTDDGTLWLNLGDSYATGGGSVGRAPGGGEQGERFIRSGMIATQPNRMPIPGLKPKDLVGIPWRLAFALQSDGWFLRSDIIWHKPAPMPESVIDRPTRSHEHVFLLSKSSRYFYNRDEARDPLKPSSISRLIQDTDLQEGSDRANGGAKTNGKMEAVCQHKQAALGRALSSSTLGSNEETGANWRDVWTIAHEGFGGAHFATMPSQLAERCVRAGSRPGDLVLDPFNGSGTTGEVAQKWGRRYVGMELNPDYIEISKQRFRQQQLFSPTHPQPTEGAVR